MVLVLTLVSAQHCLLVVVVGVLLALLLVMLLLALRARAWVVFGAGEQQQASAWQQCLGCWS